MLPIPLAALSAATFDACLCIAAESSALHRISHLFDFSKSRAILSSADEAADTPEGSKPDFMLMCISRFAMILAKRSNCHTVASCGIIRAVMGMILDSIRQGIEDAANPETRTCPPPDCFFWPGVVFVVVCMIVAIVKLASL